MVKQEKSRVINYWDLASAARTFGVNLTTDEKHSLFGKKPKTDLRIIQRRDGGYISCYKKNQTNLNVVLDIFFRVPGYLSDEHYSGRLSTVGHVFTDMKE